MTLTPMLWLIEKCAPFEEIALGGLLWDFHVKVWNLSS
jgi:hypothetical protein